MAVTSALAAVQASLDGWGAPAHVAPIAAAVLTLVATVAIYWYWPYWKVRHIPGPPIAPGIGHIHLLEKHGADLFLMLRRQYGPMFRFHLGRQPLVLVADAELCRQLAVKNHKLAPNRAVPPYIKCIEVQNEGLFFSKDAQWASMRNILLPLFHKPSLAAMQPAMMKNIDTLCSIVDDHAQAGKRVNISHLVEKMALDVVGETSLGTKLGQLQRDPKAHQKGGPDPDASLAHTVMAAINLMTMDKAASASTIIGMVFPILQHSVHSLLNKVPGTKDWLQKKANQELCRRMDDLVERRSREDEDAYGVRRERLDALTLLLRARRDDKIAGEVLKPSYITALTYEQLLAGSETTGVSICMAIYCVSQSPEVEKKLLQEIDAFGPPDQEPTPEQLDTQFPYLEKVLKETLRLHTTTPLVARQASQSFTLGGYHIPKDTWVWMATNAPQVDPQHFPDPLQFRPERFDPNCQEEKNRHPYAFLAFGAGPRMCIGQKFSMQEMKLTIIKLYQRFTFRHSPLMESPIAMQLGIISKPKYGVVLDARPRSHLVK